MPRTLPLVTGLVCAALSLGAIGCGNDQISSDEEARRAYLGLDHSIQKSLTLGFAGFNAAQSANIPTETAPGDLSGTLSITGQVDQGASNNKGMRLRVGMVMYSDGKVVIDQRGNTASLSYDTVTDTATQPALELMLKNIPTGTFTGTLMGTYQISGDIKGDATLNLMMSGTLQDGGNGMVIRMPGSTTVTGTATSGDGTYTVNVTL